MNNNKNSQVCYFYLKNNSCKYGDKCKKIHDTNEVNIKKNNNDNALNEVNKNFKKRNKKKNTECYKPMSKTVDMRVIYDMGVNKISKEITSRDVVIVPNLFSDFKTDEIYNLLVKEIETCSIPQDKLLKLWHGNHEIAGTHFILNDRKAWKIECPTFNMVIERIKNFFDINIKATRLNWYKDTSHFKPFHFDSAAVNPEKAISQNFTIGASFGISRECAFEKDDSTKNVISFPIGDGEIYCFANDTNCIWRHGVLQDTPVKNKGRISIICWGKIDNIKQL